MGILSEHSAQSTEPSKITLIYKVISQAELYGF